MGSCGHAPARLARTAGDRGDVKDHSPMIGFSLLLLELLHRLATRWLARTQPYVSVHDAPSGLQHLHGRVAAVEVERERWRRSARSLVVVGEITSQVTPPSVRHPLKTFNVSLPEFTKCVSSVESTRGGDPEQ